MHPLLREALELHQSGRLAEAEKAFQQVLQIAPHHALAIEQLGVIALQTRRAAQAVELISRAISIDDQIADWHVNLGAAYSATNRPDDAITGSYPALFASAADLPIVPGGTPGTALLHVARTVVRRAERAVWALLADDPERTSKEGSLKRNYGGVDIRRERNRLAIEKLRALGYMAYRSPVSAEALAAGLSDPKDKISDFNTLRRRQGNLRRRHREVSAGA